MTLSASARAAMFAQETGEAVYTLLRISTEHEFRFVNNTEPVTHMGHQYQPMAFRLAAPIDSADGLPRARLTLDSAHWFAFGEPPEEWNIIRILRAFNGPPPLVRMSVILASEPNTVMYGPFKFEARNARNSGLESVVIDLFGHDVRNEGYPGPLYDPGHFPAGFQR